MMCPRRIIGWPALRRGLALTLTTLLLALSGCAAVVTEPQAPRGELLWPPLPMESRIQWLREIHSREDAGVRMGFWEKLSTYVVGDTSREIVKPYGIFVDRSGRIFVADTAAAVLHVYDSIAKRYLAVGNGRDRMFTTPIGIASDGEDTLFITDAGAAAVFRYDVGRQELTPFLAGVLGRPTGIAFFPGNRLLYISDTTTHQVVVFDLAGRERFRIGHRGAAPGAFNYPTDLCISPRGELFVTDALNSRIQVFDVDGHFLRSFGAPGDTPGYLAKPKGVALDSEGHVYVADAMQDTVQIFDPDGTLLLNFGAGGQGPGQFWMPAGLFIDGNDLVYVADTYNRRIQVFKYLKTEGGAGGAQTAPGRRP